MILNMKLMPPREEFLHNTFIHEIFSKIIFISQFFLKHMAKHIFTSTFIVFYKIIHPSLFLIFSSYIKFFYSLISCKSVLSYYYYKLGLKFRYCIAKFWRKILNMMNLNEICRRIEIYYLQACIDDDLFKSRL